MLPQAAQSAIPALEAGKSGIAVFMDAGMIGLVLTNSALLIKALIDRKAVKKQLDAEPVFPCDDHIARIIKLEASIVPDKEKRIATLEANYVSTTKLLDDMRRENREDHHQIFVAIEQLKK
jgi:hypothetical protein